MKSLIARNDVWDDFDLMFKNFDSMFTEDTFFQNTFSPSVEVNNEKDKLEVVAEIPQMKKEDIKVKVEDNYLVLEGEKKKKSKNSSSSEVFYGKFKRSFYLGNNVDESSAKAEVKDGVLRITFKKKEKKEKIKEIEIN